MIEQELDLQTKDGAMNTFITRPDGDGPYPVVVFLMDAPGKRGAVYLMTALLEEGAADLRAQAYARKLESLAASVADRIEERTRGRWRADKPDSIV